MSDDDTASVDAAATAPARPRLEVGTQVEVRSRFDSSWTKGFEIADVLDDGYRVRRQHDGSVLPSVFGVDEVRRERSRATWWV
jgi:hypothetical protein